MDKKQFDLETEKLKLKQQEIDLQERNNEILKEAIAKGTPLLQRHIELKNRNEGSKVKWSIIGFLSILVIVISASTFLVYHDKLDPANFTFLLGTLIGATITLLGDIIIPS